MNILIVDDDTYFAEDIGSIIEELSHIHLYAQNKKGALAQFQSYPAIGLIIFDTELKPTNEMGYEVYDALLAKGYKNSALALSASTDAKIIWEWKQRNVRFLSKTTKLSDLRNVIKPYLEK